MNNVKLSDVCNLIDSLHITPKYIEKGFPMVRAADISNKFLDLTNCVQVSKSTLDKHNKKYVPKKGDILITRVGVNLGNVSYNDTKEIFCLGQNISIISSSDNGKFLYYYLLSPKMQSFIKKLISGSAYKCIGFEKLKELPCNFNNINCTKIGNLLYSIDKKINLNNKINDKLESMAKTIYDYWFLQFEFPNEEGKPYKSSGGKMIWNEELKREIPEGWDLCTIEDISICHDAKRIPLSNKEREQMKGDIPYYGATGIMDYVNQYIFDGDYVLIAEDGSIMNDDGSPILQRISGKTWVNNHAHILEPIDNYSCKFLMMILKDIPVVTIKTGSIQMKINQKNLNKVKIVSVPNNLKNRINRILNDIDKKILLNKKENQELTALRDFLLPLLMNGQVGFKEDKAEG